MNRTEDVVAALDAHLRAIRDRDLEAFAATVDPDEVVLITAAGEFATDAGGFLDRHRDWFAQPGWTLDARLLHCRVAGDLATCVVELDYRDEQDGREVREGSLLGLVFARRDGRWLLVQDQNTPRREGGSG